jgi:hypothetical protein
MQENRDIDSEEDFQRALGQADAANDGAEGSRR